MRTTAFRSRVVTLALLALVSQACVGSCSSLPGARPIPGGYPPTEGVANGVQARVTPAGLATASAHFCEIFGSALTDVTIPETHVAIYSGSVGTTVPWTICASPAVCTARVTCVGGAITATTGARMHLRVDARYQSYTNGVRAPWPGVASLGPVFGDQSIPADVDTARGVPYSIGVDVDISAVTIDARRGISQWVLSSLDVPTPESADVTASSMYFAAGFTDPIRSFIAVDLHASVQAGVQASIDAASCLAVGAGCPFGTYARGPYCRVADNDTAACVPSPIGFEVEGDLGSLTGSSGAFGQFAAIASGDGLVASSGMDLFFRTGLRGTDESFATSPAAHPCVPRRSAPTGPALARTSVLVGDTLPGLSTPADIGFALSESTLSTMLFGLYDSGALCIDVDGTEVPVLRTALLSMIDDRLRPLLRPNDTAPLRVALRPQQPPTADFHTVGTQPRVDLSFPRAQLDVELFMEDRYERILTYGTDLVVPFEIATTAGAVQLQPRGPSTTTSFIGNTELLGSAPTGLVDVLDAAAPLLVGALTAQLPALQLPDVGAFHVAATTNAVAVTTSMGEDYVEVYGSMQWVAPDTRVADTTLEVALVDVVDPRAASLDTFAEAETPVVELRVASSVGSAFEVSYRIDGSPWSAWMTDDTLWVADRALLLQGRHVIEARARMAGEPASADPTPAASELLVDLRAPDISITPATGAFTAVAADVISGPGEVELRVRPAGGAWDGWRPGPRSGLAPGSDVEARDEAGNVAHRTIGDRASASPAVATSAVTCSASPGAPPLGPATLVIVALMGAMAARRRRWQARRSRHQPERGSTTLVRPSCSSRVQLRTFR